MKNIRQRLSNRPVRPPSQRRPTAWVNTRSWTGIHCGILRLGAGHVLCSLGRTGIRSQKREGDGATPRGSLVVLGGFYNPLAARSGRFDGHFWHRTKPDDGWCDSPDDPNYNMPVKLPFSPSHEELRRSDQLYDRVIVLDWNITERGRNRGSAIFFHQARIRDGTLQPTEGCIAIKADDFRRRLTVLRRLKRIVVL